MKTFVNWMKCKHCGCTDCFFHAYTRRLKNRKVVRRTSQTCELCYKEEKKVWAKKTYDKNRLKYLSQKKEHYYNNLKKMRLRSLDYHYKNKEEQNMKRRMRYEKIYKKKKLTKSQKFVEKMKKRVSLSNRDNFFMTEVV